MPDSEHAEFQDLATELAASLRHVIFIDSVVYPYEDRQRVLRLLEQHVTGNLVKIGREFFRQRVGIPQGSSLSTLLCSFFYADLEREKLGFVHEPGSALLRYTDDFLFVSTSRRKARTFFEIMCKGHPEYGCFISPEKSLTNMDLMLEDGGFVPRIRDTAFPWCGYVLDTTSLAVRADLERYRAIREWSNKIFVVR